MPRTLAVNVVVDEAWYGPDYNNADRVPDEVAAQLGDHVWAVDDLFASERSDAHGDAVVEQPKPLEEWKKEELATEIDRLRGEGAVIDVEPPGNKPELLAALRNYIEG